VHADNSQSTSLKENITIKQQTEHLSIYLYCDWEPPTFTDSLKFKLIKSILIYCLGIPTDTASHTGKNLTTRSTLPFK